MLSSRVAKSCAQVFVVKQSEALWLLLELLGWDGMGWDAHRGTFCLCRSAQEVPCATEQSGHSSGINTSKAVCRAGCGSPAGRSGRAVCWAPLGTALCLGTAPSPPALGLRQEVPRTASCCAWLPQCRVGFVLNKAVSFVPE